LLLVLSGIVAGHALISGAWAAGYGLKEHSARAMGAAYAGSAADTDEAGALVYNPASLSGVAGTDASISLVEIVPHSSATYTGATTSAGTPASGSAAPRSFIADAPVPAIAVRHRLTDDLAAGLSVSAPYGLKTVYPAGWAGRYHALKSEAVTVNIAPAIAWTVTPELALGAALNVEYARGEVTSAVDIGTLGALNAIPGAIPGAFDGAARLSGMDWATGFSLGAVYRPAPDLTLGLSWQSAIFHRLAGPLTFTLDSAGLGAAIRAATGFFTDTRAAAKLATPDMLLFGARKDVSDDFSLMAELDWTNWSRFRALTITAQNPAQPDDVTLADWHDTIFASLGGEYRLDEGWKLRAGIGFDQSPVPDATRNPRIPDADRLWLAAGLEARLSPGARLHLAYGHLFNSDSSIGLTQSQPGNALRGNLAGTTRSTVDTIGLQIASTL
jgi:long-chain fatty acid transport protein